MLPAGSSILLAVFERRGCDSISKGEMAIREGKAITLDELSACLG